MSNKNMQYYFLFFFLLVFYQASFAQEIGQNDFQISLTGTNGDTDAEAKNVALAYNSTNNEYLAVWAANEIPGNNGAMMQYEILGQRLNGSTGAAIGNSFRISDMGPEDSDAYGANAPAVIYNSQDNEYLVVWYGDDNTGNAVRNEAEIWGQRINAATGQEVGQNDFRISTMGPNGNSAADGKFPALAYNSQNNEYLVVWYGDVFFDEKLEVWGQRLKANGQEVGANDFRISVSGGSSDTRFGGYDPAVTYNSVGNEYLVVWYGAKPPAAADEDEIWGQRISNSGTFLGTNGFQISDIGKDGSKNFAAKSPNVIFNSVNNEYLVVWSGNEEGYDKKDYRTWGQRLNGSTGAEIGTNDFLISDIGPDQVLPSENHVVDVAYDSAKNQYLVVWSADDYDGASTDGELEIWGKRLQGTNGSNIESQDFRISDVGSDGDKERDAAHPYVVFNSQTEEYLVAWHADERDDEFEIYGQRLTFGASMPTCNDGILNGNETETDCGGPDCPACPTCDDGIQNGDETGVDCGGSCTACEPNLTCDDGILNGNETGIDCGGSECPACLNNIPPTTSFIEPVDGQNFTEGYHLIVRTTANDSDGTIAQVELFYDGVSQGQDSALPYNWSLPNLALGTHTLKVIATDNEGAMGEQTISIVVNLQNTTCDDGILNGDETGIDCGGNNCPECLCSDITINDDPITEGTYSYQSITSDGRVEALDVVVFVAADFIKLEAGFHAENNSDFTARIGACSPSLTVPENRSVILSKNKLSIQPNPFHQNTSLVLEVQEAAFVQIDVYNMNGKLVRKIVSNHWLEKGIHTFQYEDFILSSGVYFLVANTGKGIITKKMVIE